MRQILIVLALASAGCGSAGALHSDPAYRERETLQTSVMKDEKAILSEDSIQKLLASRIVIPDKTKLAVFPLEHRGLHGEAWMGHSYTRPIEFIQAEKEFLTAVEDPLMKTGRFKEISHMPRLLLPSEPSLTRLREAAALMQADLLLVYRTRSELVTSRGFLFFSKDEVAVNSSIELFLMDVKTSVVPYAETFDGVHTEKEVSADRGIVDTQRRAEKEGTLKVIRKATEGLVGFLGRR